MILFDLDGTLAESKSAINTEISAALARLLKVFEVCVISGGSEKQIVTQVVEKLPFDANLENLHLMPTCGSKYLKYQTGKWEIVYDFKLEPEVVNEAKTQIKKVAQDLGLWVEDSFGDIIEDRGSQITFSALGQNAPIALKEDWDRDGSKKELLRRNLSILLPTLEVRKGGSTSIDITAQGMDKAFGVEKLREYGSKEIGELLFIGDRLEFGGNDYPVLKTGIQTKKVLSWEDTLEIINDLLKGRG